MEDTIMGAKLTVEDDEALEDANLEDEDLDEGADEDVEEEDAEVDEDSDEEADEEEDDEEDDDTSKDVKKSAKASKAAPFDKKQQAEVNKLIKTRLDRQEATLVRELSRAAGVDIDRKEVSSAARLWGLLKSNPELSKDVDGVIAAAFTSGKAKAPASEDPAKETQRRIDLKEAILDLKASDTTFSKNADKIVTWAENEGYEVYDAKSLKMAYLAWKGSQGKVAEAIQKSTAQRKQTAKKLMQKRATVQSAKSSHGAVRTGKSYSKMSDAAVLQAEGLSLFTED